MRWGSFHGARRAGPGSPARDRAGTIECSRYTRALTRFSLVASGWALHRAACSGRRAPWGYPPNTVDSGQRASRREARPIHGVSYPHSESCGLRTVVRGGFVCSLPDAGPRRVFSSLQRERGRASFADCGPRDECRTTETTSLGAAVWAGGGRRSAPEAREYGGRGRIAGCVVSGWCLNLDNIVLVAMLAAVSTISRVVHALGKHWAQS